MPRDDERPHGGRGAAGAPGVSRRQALKVLGAAPAAVGLTWTAQEAEAAQRRASQARKDAGAAAYAPKFFNPHEWQTVRLLADLIIPRDERSGSATDAGVPEFMDFMLIDQPYRQAAMRGGLRWLDQESRRRFGRTFVAATADQQIALVEDIAWPNRPPAAFTQGTAFFTAFRDLTASGFWTSRMGIDDLQYQGNKAVHEWTGCPDEALRHLGLIPRAD